MGLALEVGNDDEKRKDHKIGQDEPGHYLLRMPRPLKAVKAPLFAGSSGLGATLILRAC